MSTFFTDFGCHMDHISCRVPHRLVCVFTHWMGSCVYVHVVPLLFLWKPKQGCPFLDGNSQASCSVMISCTPMWNVLSVGFLTKMHYKMIHISFTLCVTS